MKDFYEPNCAYKNRCKSKGLRCNTCRHNKKEDHYEPIPWGPWPPQPPMPFRPPLYISEPYLM